MKRRFKLNFGLHTCGGHPGNVFEMSRCRGARKFKRVPFPKGQVAMLAVTLSSMENDAQAVTADWLRLLAVDLGTDTVDAQAVIKFGAAPLVAKLSRLGTLFKMARRRACEIMTEAGGDESLIEVMELQSGFNFRESSVPASADLIESAGHTSRIGFHKKQRPTSRKIVPTLSDVFEDAGTLLDQIVPEHCFAVITTYEGIQ